MVNLNLFGIEFATRWLILTSKQFLKYFSLDEFAGAVGVWWWLEGDDGSCKPLPTWAYGEEKYLNGPRPLLELCFLPAEMFFNFFYLGEMQEKQEGEKN